MRYNDLINNIEQTHSVFFKHTANAINQSPILQLATAKLENALQATSIQQNKKNSLPNKKFDKVENSYLISLIQKISFFHFVEYATAGMDENLFVSKYMLQLPQKKKLEDFLRNELKMINYE